MMIIEAFVSNDQWQIDRIERCRNAPYVSNYLYYAGFEPNLLRFPVVMFIYLPRDLGLKIRFEVFRLMSYCLNP